MQESILYVNARDGDSIRIIVKRIGIPLNELGRNIFLNGEYSGLERQVKDKDRLGIFPDDMQLLYRQYFNKVNEN